MGASLLAVAVGSGLGGLLRHLLTEGMLRLTGPGFPWGTLLVNTSGSLAIGACSALIAAGWPAAWGASGRLGVVSGLLGGFTTFSAFAAQTVGLTHAERVGPAVAYVAASVGLSLAACWFGSWAVDRVLR